MDYELFMLAITQASLVANDICFHVMGDPLAHPHLSYFLDLALEKGAKVVITTAGHLLTREKYKILTHAAIKQVNFSLGSFEANDQKRSLDDYLEGLAQFVDFAMGENPELYINWRLWNQGVEQSTHFTRDVFHFIEKRFGVTPHDEKKSFPLKGRFYLHFEKRFVWPSLELDAFQTEGFCHALKNQFGILVDGSVVPCCLDGQGIIKLGNIQKTPLQEILSSKRASNMREGFAAKKLVEPLCQTCGYIDRFS